MTAHPSSLRLDAIALGEPADDATAHHLRDCARCAAALAEARRPPHVPAWLDGLARPERPKPPRRPFGDRWLAALLAPALAAAIAAGLFALRPPQRRADGVREKAAPSVALYLKRGDAVSTWDGRSPLRTGDRIRIGIRGAGYRHVSVATISSSGGPPAVLHVGRLNASGESLLPTSFRVDSPGGAEVLSVILGDDAIAPAAHAAAPPGSPGNRWTLRITLPVEPAP